MAPKDAIVIASSSEPAAWEPFAKGINDIRGLVSCKICTRLMHEPFTTKCGHTFCYSCLSQWLNRAERRGECPDCRAKLREQPSPSYTIRNIVHTLIANSAFLEDGDTTEALTKEQDDQAREINTDRDSEAGLFAGLFKHRFHDPLRDAADGVERCPNCYWELEDSYCGRCDIHFDDDDSLAGFSEDDFEAGYSDADLDDMSDNSAGFGGRYFDMETEEWYDDEELNTEDEAFIDDDDDDREVTQAELDGERNITNVGSQESDPSQGAGTVSSPYEVSDNEEDQPLGPHHQHVGASVSDDTDSGFNDSGSESEEDSGSDNSSNGTNTSTDDESDASSTPPASRRQGRNTLQVRPRVVRFADPVDPPVSFRPGRRPRHRPGRASAVVDLTTPEIPTTTRSRRRQILSDDEEDEVDITNAATTQSTTADEQDIAEDSEPVVPSPRRRKRERIIVEDSDDEGPVTVSRESRSRRRRLNHQIPGEFGGHTRSRRTTTGQDMTPSHHSNTISERHRPSTTVANNLPYRDAFDDLLASE